MQSWGMPEFIIAIAVIFVFILPVWFLWLKSFLKNISPVERNILRNTNSLRVGDLSK